MISALPNLKPGQKTAATLLATLATLALLGAAGNAAAQARPAAPNDLPPRTQLLEEGAAPTLTKPKPGVQPGTGTVPNGTTDLRDNSGAVIETRVKTPLTTYTVRPNKQVGNAQPGDAQSSPNRAAQFKVGEFGRGPKQAAPVEPIPETLQPASAAPAGK